MKTFNKVATLLISLFAFGLSHADEKNGFYVVAEAGSTEMAAPSTSKYSITSNSYNFGAGYEVDSLSVEFTYGNGFNLSSTIGSTTTELSLSNYTLVVNYKILNSGNFRPFVGIGRYGGTTSFTGYASEDYSRNMWNVGVEVPLDNTTSIRAKYIKTFELTGYVGFTSYSLGLLYRF